MSGKKGISAGILVGLGVYAFLKIAESYYPFTIQQNEQFSLLLVYLPYLLLIGIGFGIISLYRRKSIIGTFEDSFIVVSTTVLNVLLFLF